MGTFVVEVGVRCVRGELMRDVMYLPSAVAKRMVGSAVVMVGLDVGCQWDWSSMLLVLMSKALLSVIIYRRKDDASRHDRAMGLN